MFLSVKLHCFNQRKRANTALSEKENLNEMHSKLAGAKNKNVLSNAMLSWPFQGEQQLASPDSRITGLSSEFIQRIDANPPKVSFI